jgi:hypothetical protein
MSNAEEMYVGNTLLKCYIIHDAQRLCTFYKRKQVQIWPISRSSGSIVSDYGLDDRAFGVRSPAGVEDFSSNLCVQTGSGAHQASCTMGTGGKARPGRDADHSPHLLPRSVMSRSYTFSPPKRLHGV